jgi:DNA-binding response OmpR family regulator
MKILLLEDEYSLRISIKEFLEDEGYMVDDFADGEEAYEAIYSSTYDILLFDVNVPTMSGFEVLKAIREDGNTTPTLFLTSMTDIQSLKEGYNRGCCDYIRKPFDLEELELRITQHYNKHYMQEDQNINLGDNLEYNMKTQQLLYNNNQIILRKIEQEILELLIKNKDSVVSMSMFQDEIWCDYVDPGTIRAQIKNLKHALPSGELIKNRRGLGYIIER